MNSSLVTLIRHNSRPLEPLPTNVEARHSARTGLRAALFDIYGTILISGSGDVGSGSSGVVRSDAAHDALRAVGLDTDCDGVQIVQQLHRVIATHHQRLQAAGVRFPEVDIVTVWKETLQHLQRHRMLADDDQIDCHRLAIEYEMRVNPVWPMPGAESCLQALRQQGVVLGIISNAQFFTPLAWTASFGRSPRQMGFAPGMQYFSYEHALAKPGRELYRLAAEALAQAGISPEETLYVGNDMRNDIVPAAETGFVTALFAGDRRSLRLRKDDPEIAGRQPDMVITALEQILQIFGVG